MVPTPTVFVESTDWEVGNRLQTPTKVLIRSGHFNVQHDVHVQFTFSHFDTACPWTWTVVRPLVSVATDSDLFHAGDDPLMLPRWFFLDWLVYPIPLGGLGCEPLQDAIAATRSQQVANVMHTWPYYYRGWWIVWNCRHACALCHCWRVHIQLFRCVRGVHRRLSCIMHGSG